MLNNKKHLPELLSIADSSALTFQVPPMLLICFCAAAKQSFRITPSQHNTVSISNVIIIIHSKNIFKQYTQEIKETPTIE